MVEKAIGIERISGEEGCQRLRCIAMLRLCVYDRVPGALHTGLWFWDHQSPTLTQTYSYAHDSSFTSTRINMQSGLMETSACNRRGSSYHSQFSVFPPILLGQLRRNHNINKDFFLISATIDHTLLILQEILVIEMIYNSTFPSIRWILITTSGCLRARKCTSPMTLFTWEIGSSTHLQPRNCVSE